MASFELSLELNSVFSLGNNCEVVCFSDVIMMLILVLDVFLAEFFVFEDVMRHCIPG